MSLTLILMLMQRLSSAIDKSLNFMSVNFYTFSKTKTVSSHDGMIEVSTDDAANRHQVVKPNPFLIDKAISTCPPKNESKIES
jgi:hypothetical protein